MYKNIKIKFIINGNLRKWVQGTCGSIHSLIQIIDCIQFKLNLETIYIIFNLNLNYL